MESFDRIVETFLNHKVRFIVIGNYGAQLHGVKVETQDADMAYQRSEDNHQRILAAMQELDAHLRFGDSTARLPTDVPNLLDQSDVWTLRTIYGDVDLLYAPAGGGYNHLLANAELVTVRGYPVLVASLDDIIHSKELANRDKDGDLGLGELPELAKRRSRRIR